ncbi:MAG TPA: transcriptional regulator NrdR [Ilumatobacteraceae bacterium]|nr:transcriptional regulator NrdR [Ilumatobacteraceae bacterium]
MRCPRCRADDTKVIDSREAEEGASIRRRRLCASCQHRFTTYERLEEVPMVVVKSSGSREPFDRAKIVAGIAAAAKGRPVTPEQIEQLSIELEDHSRLQGNEITSAELGVEVLERLRSLDVVTYLRFASVYKNFDAAADFQRELVLLKRLQSS